jgi:hypothetical protein
VDRLCWADAVKSDSIERARERLRAALEQTVEREQQLGRAGFHLLPAKVQNHLAALQAQTRPDDDSLEAIMAAERLLKTYNSELDNAQNLVAQLSGEAGRRAQARRKRGARMLLAFGVVLVIAAGVTLYYRSALADKARSCRAAPPCAGDGLCGAGMRADGASPFDIECRAVSAEDCNASQGCRGQGRCSLVDGRCIAASADDCAKSPGCKEDGWCSAQDGRCVAAQIQDCRPTRACTERGACTPIDGVCVAGSDADCRQSEMCRKHGACSEVEHRCIKSEFAPHEP